MTLPKSEMTSGEMEGQAELHPPISPVLVIGVGLLAVSTAAIFIRYAQAEADSLVIAALRLSLAALILTPYALRRAGPELRRLTRRDLALALTSGLFLALHFATWITSLAYTSVVSSVVLVQTAPLWVAVLAPVFLHERLDRRILWGMALALAGGVVVSIGESCGTGLPDTACLRAGLTFTGRAGIGNLLALAGALAAACYLVIGRRLRARLTLAAYIYVVYSMAAIVLLVAMFASGRSPFGYSAQTYLWLLLLAVIPQLIGHTSFNWALGYLPASFVSVTLLGEPIGSAVLALLLLNETPSVVKLTGAALILAGIYLASKSSRTRNRPVED